MFAIIRKNQIIGFTDEEITKENMLFDELIEGEFDTDKKYIFENGEVKENIIEIDEKQKAIQEYKELEHQATELRAKFLTYELDESPLTQAMKQKLDEKGEIIKTQIKEKAGELVEKYGVDILDELV